MYAYHVWKCIGSATFHWTLSLDSFQHFLISITCICIVSSFIIKFCKCVCSWSLPHLCQNHVNWTPLIYRWWDQSCSRAVRGENRCINTACCQHSFYTTRNCFSRYCTIWSLIATKWTNRVTWMFCFLHIHIQMFYNTQIFIMIYMAS